MKTSAIQRQHGEEERCLTNLRNITGSPYERLLKQVDKVVSEAGSDRTLAKTLRKLVKTVTQQYEEGNIDEEEHDLVIEAIEEVDPEGPIPKNHRRFRCFYDEGDMPDSPELKLASARILTIC